MKKFLFLYFIITGMLLFSSCCCCCTKGNWKYTNDWMNNKTNKVTPAVTTIPADNENTGGPIRNENTGSPLQIVDFTFTDGEEGPSTGNTVPVKGTIYFKFSVKGLSTESDGKVWVVEDCMLKDSTGRELQNDKALLDYHDVSGEKDFPVINNYTFTDAHQPGKYFVNIIITDKNSGKTVETTEEFEII
jgi:hypothetical protein